MIPRVAKGDGSRREAATADRPIAAARIGLIFGLASIACSLAGIPAIVLGWIALRQIARAGGRPAGRGAAIAAVVLGCAFGIFIPLVMSTYALPMIRMFRTMRQTSTDVEVAQINAAFHAAPLPDWLVPVWGSENPMQGQRQVIYLDRVERPTLLLAVNQIPPFLAEMFMNQTHAQLSMSYGIQFTSQESRTATWGEGDETIAVTIDSGIAANTNLRQKRYAAIVSKPKHALGLLVITPEPDPANPEARSLSEEEVKAIFLSYAFPPETPK
jgi:hypothetical protein